MKKQFKTESKQLLELMIHSIYSNKEIFLRELISNASDALSKAEFSSLKGESNLTSELKIEVKVDKDQRVIEISDNGIGMDESDLESFLGTIAKSGTKAFVKSIENKDDQMNAIGQFGVGFYSSYLVAKEVVVTTKKQGQNAFRWVSDGVSDYEITKTQKDENGTTIRLNISDGEEYDKFLDVNFIQSLIKKHSDFISYPIYMNVEITNQEGETSIENKIVNSQKAIWKKNKSELTKDNYNDFYKTTFNDFIDPKFYFSANVEGALSFNLLVFVPTKNQFMQMNPENKNTFKLYSKEVLIDEDASYLLPQYLGFVRGIVDCADLNLNISREMLQQDKVVSKLKASIEKRIIKELNKLKNKNFDDYVKIWQDYGRDLTFGSYIDYGAKKDLIKDLLIFKSNKSQNYISLNDYCKNNESSDEILYVVGSDIEIINKMPVMEQFIDSNKEVLYFLADIDEFAIKVLESYNDKKFVSVSEFKGTKQEDSKEITNETNSSQDLLNKIKGFIDSEVNEVVLTDKLKTSPVKLSSNSDISIEMEKTLQNQESGQNVKASKVLELNMNHDIYAKLKNVSDEQLEIYAKVLLDQAKLVEGLNVKDPLEYVSNVNKLIAK